MKKIKHSNTREQILAFIRESLKEKGYTPTVRDIVKGCNISTTSVVQHHLNRLEKDGVIQRDPQVFRSIRLVGPDVDFSGVPLMGTIAAGEPIPVPASDNWVNEPLEMLKVPAELIPQKASVFALRVKGQSMIDALIDDGDIVLMEPVKTVENGEMAAVWLRDKQEVTLKRLYREADKVRLQPANSTMSPIIVQAENVEVQGRVVAVIRKM